MAKSKSKKPAASNDDSVNIGDLDMNDIAESKPLNYKDLLKKASSGLSLAAQALRFINLLSGKKK